MPVRRWPWRRRSARATAATRRTRPTVLTRLSIRTRVCRKTRTSIEEKRRKNPMSGKKKQTNKKPHNSNYNNNSTTPPLRITILMMSDSFFCLFFFLFLNSAPVAKELAPVGVASKPRPPTSSRARRRVFSILFWRVFVPINDLSGIAMLTLHYFLEKKGKQPTNKTNKQRKAVTCGPRLGRPKRFLKLFLLSCSVRPCFAPFFCEATRNRSIRNTLKEPNKNHIRNARPLPPPPPPPTRSRVSVSVSLC